MNTSKSLFHSYLEQIINEEIKNPLIKQAQAIRDLTIDRFYSDTRLPKKLKQLGWSEQKIKSMKLDPKDPESDWDDDELARALEKHFKLPENSLD